MSASAATIDRARGGQAKVITARLGGGHFGPGKG
jgi:hypothetical protein